MSHGKRKPRPKRIAKAVKHHPDSAGSPDGARFLAAIAMTLNAAEHAGIPVTLAHGAVITPAGYVLPVGRNGDVWAARTRDLLDFRAPDSHTDDD